MPWGGEFAPLGGSFALWGGICPLGGYFPGGVTHPLPPPAVPPPGASPVSTPPPPAVSPGGSWGRLLLGLALALGVLAAVGTAAIGVQTREWGGGECVTPSCESLV